MQLHLPSTSSAFKASFLYPISQLSQQRHLFSVCASTIDRAGHDFQRLCAPNKDQVYFKKQKGSQR